LFYACNILVVDSRDEVWFPQERLAETGRVDVVWTRGNELNEARREFRTPSDWRKA